MSCIRLNTTFKKWDLQVTFFAIYKVHTYAKHLMSATCRMHSRCELIKPATSVYIVREQLICHQPVMHMLAHSVFPICVVRALLHTHVFFKFKLNCIASVYNYFNHLANTAGFQDTFFPNSTDITIPLYRGWVR